VERRTAIREFLKGSSNLDSHGIVADDVVALQLPTSTVTDH
jgi:hypothetical protein